MAVKKVDTAIVEENEQPGTVENLKEKYRVSDHIHAGICSRNGWGKGKQVPETIYRKAAEGFGRLPMGGRAGNVK